MREYRLAIGNGGHLVHALPKVGLVALCGYEPKTRRNTRFPSGWYVRGVLTEATCPRCKELTREGT